MNKWLPCFVSAALVACAAAPNDPGDRISTKEDAHGVEAKVLDDGDRVQASIDWDRDKKVASWTVGDQRGSLDAPSMSPADAERAMGKLWSLHSKVNHSAYVTCATDNICDGFTLDGGRCNACVQIMADCTTVLSWSCIWETQ